MTALLPARGTRQRRGKRRRAGDMGRRGRRRAAAPGRGEARLRAVLRRWRRAGSRSPAEDTERSRWWPRLTAPQVQALLGAALTLALMLWEQVRQRLR